MYLSQLALYHNLVKKKTF